MTTLFDVNTFDVALFDKILAKGLSSGLGNREQQVCIEAALCQTLGLPHGDDPGCVADSVRRYKIQLNDSKWSSTIARAKGLRSLGLAQLGSRKVVSDIEFSTHLARETIRILLPAMIRDLFPRKENLFALATACEKEHTANCARALQKELATYAATYATSAADAAANAAVNATTYAATSAAYAAAYAANAATYAADAAANAAVNAANAAANAATYAATYAANAATYAANAADADKYLILSATIALQILKDLKSPGVILL